MTQTVERTRRRTSTTPTPVVDRLPPHSLEMEQGVLGCAMLAPDAAIPLAIAQLGDGESDAPAFYDLRHQTIWETLLEMHRTGDPIDMITLPEQLKASGQLDGVGGLAYISAIADAVPSSANLPFYLGAVVEKLAARRLIRACTEVVGRIYGGESTPADAVVDLEIAVTRAKQSVADELQPSIGWDDLCSFNTAFDESTLLGVRKDDSGRITSTTRYLCRGGSAWLIGPSGLGKSSLAMQMAVCWAAGQSAFGITPPRPLKVLVVQAENDLGDMAEMIQGIARGLKLDDDSFDLPLVQANLRVISEDRRIGQNFTRWLKQVLLREKPDLVMVDPLLSFAGIDVSRQDQCSQFLRTWLNPVLHSTGVAIIGVHHTGKPAKDKRQTKDWGAVDYAYAGLGSSELVNWARAIQVLWPVGDHHYTLRLAKRGKRAGATHPDGQPATTLWLKHADHGIHWEQIPPPPEDAPEGQQERQEQAKERKKPMPDRIAYEINTAEFLAGCLPDGEGLREIKRRLEDWLADQRPAIDASATTCERAIGLLVSSGKLAKKAGRYLKGENA